MTDNQVPRRAPAERIRNILEQWAPISFLGCEQKGSALTALAEFEAERDTLRAQLETLRTDPVAVHVAMLRGDIAKLDPRTFAHVWGSVFNDNEAANIEIAKLRAKLAEYERAPTVAYLSIDCIGERYLLFSRPNDNDELHELIARPRKEGE